MCFVGWYIMVEIQWRKKRGEVLREGVGLEAHQTLLACLDNGWCNQGSTVQSLWLWPVTASLPPDQLPLAAQTFNLFAFSFKSYPVSLTLSPKHFVQVLFLREKTKALFQQEATHFTTTLLSEQCSPLSYDLESTVTQFILHPQSIWESFYL